MIFVLLIALLICSMAWMSFGWVNCLVWRLLMCDYPFEPYRALGTHYKEDIVDGHLFLLMLGPIITLPLLLLSWGVFFIDWD